MILNLRPAEESNYVFMFVEQSRKILDVEKIVIWSVRDPA